MVEDSGNPGVGGPQEPPPVLQGPHPRYLQVLVGRQRVAEPGIVADIDEIGRLRQGLAHLDGKDVLVADGDPGQALADPQQRPCGSARAEIRHGDLEGPGERSQPILEGNVLAEGDQVALMVDVLGGSDTDQTIEVIARIQVQYQDPEHHFGAPLPRLLRQGPDEGLAHLMQVVPDRRLRPQDQVAVPVLAGKPQVGAQVGEVRVRVPFHGRWDICLHHGGAEAFPIRLGPLDTFEGGAGEPDQAESDRRGIPEPPPPRYQAPEQSGAQRQHQTNPVDADDGRETRQRGIDLGIPDGEPGKAREDPVPQPFGQEPGRGKRQQWTGCARTVAESGRQGAGDAIEEDQYGDQRTGYQVGQPRVHIAVPVQADADPEDPETHQADPEPQTDHEAFTGGCPV